MNRSIPGTALRLAPALALLLASTAARPAGAVTDLKRGDPAPVLRLETVDGRAIDTGAMSGSSLVLLFGQTGHEQTRRASLLVQKALQDPDLRREAVEWLVILSRQSEPDRLEPFEERLRNRPLVIHDEDRRAFGAYKVAAMPTIVVVDGQGKVVHAMASVSLVSGDIIAAALHLAAGQITVEDFEKAMHPSTRTGPDSKHLQAARLARLARRMMLEGSVKVAEINYRKALALDPELISARLGLGNLYLRRDDLPRAEAQFRSALQTHPRSFDAAVGLASIHERRGGDELDEAERLARDVIERSPHHARAHYVLGLILQKCDRPDEAAASFRLAAELLLERLGLEETIDHDASDTNRTSRVDHHEEPRR